MYIHIALYAWKPEVSPTAVNQALAEIEALAPKISGIVEISAAENTSQYSEGFTHVILVRAESAAAIDAYRAHPDHIALAKRLEAMEERGIGADLVTRGKL